VQTGKPITRKFDFEDSNRKSAVKIAAKPVRHGSAFRHDLHAGFDLAGFKVTRILGVVAEQVHH
jgi:hypothetical protein